MSTWTDLSPATTPNQRYDAGIAWDYNDERVIMAGGVVSGVAVDDTWAFESGDWTDLSAPLPEPAIPCMFWDGTQIVANYASLSAVRTVGWTGSAWVDLAPGTQPSSRSDAVAALVPQGYVVMFGGQDISGTLDETWLWDGDWTQVFPATSPPASRTGVLGSDGIETLWFGGASVGSETWRWNHADTNWDQLTPATTPPAREYAVMARSASDQLVMFGGADGGGYFNDTWAWVNGRDWCECLPDVSPTPARDLSAMTYTPEGPIMFGGENPTGQDDTWQFQGSCFCPRGLYLAPSYAR